MNEKPLAERMRPNKLDEFLGQTKLLGKGKPISKFVENKYLPSLIFWGPPGVGKTTLAQILAKELDASLFQLSAIESSVKEVRAFIETAKKMNHVVLFIDEIHRFSKSQQDSLLKAVEQGTITLIGATTENPSFEVINALLSRTQVFILESLSKQELDSLLRRAITKDEYLKTLPISISETDALLSFSGGDARKMLNMLEAYVAYFASEKEILISNEKVEKVFSEKGGLYDKNGEQHYDTISAFIKSMRGSDPNAAMFYLARMILAGEDPKFIARRLLIFASEDIGNANPNALLLANNCFQAVQVVGYPECELILSQTSIYLATSVKSNASYEALKRAKKLAKENLNVKIPLHIRNAPTKLMKELNYGKNYKYAHNYEGNFVMQEFMPEGLEHQTIYIPGDNPREKEHLARLKKYWKEKYKY